MKKRIGFLGPIGTFSYEAAYLLSNGKAEFVPMASFKEIVDGVTNRIIDEGVLPVENTVRGCIGSAVDAIIAGNGGVCIKGEYILPIHHCLIAADTIDLMDVKTVVSMDEAMGQCQSWIEANLPENVKQEYVKSTATAIRDLKTYGPGVVAIGSKLAAKLYGGVIVAKNIQDEGDIATHFLVLAKKDARRQVNCKTSMIYSAAHKPGALYRSLGIFDSLNINLLKMESRPVKKRLHEYIFLVDIEGHRLDPKIKVALEALETKVKHLKVLGSYPRRS